MMQPNFVLFLNVRRFKKPEQHNEPTNIGIIKQTKNKSTLFGCVQLYPIFVLLTESECRFLVH